MSSMYIFLIILMVLTIWIIIKSGTNNLVSIKSQYDNEYYMVRDVEDKQVAANLLAKIRQTIFDITRYLYENIDNYKNMKEHIMQLSNNIKNMDILESGEDSSYTSYSVYNGEQVVFCLRSKQNKNRLHKLNLLMYVVLHEMAHIACPEYGHTQLFKDIFAFITTEAIKLNYYTKIEFDKQPEEYCGMSITDSIV